MTSFAMLDAAGLNLQAVMNIDSLPPALADALKERGGDGRYRQLIVVGHGGKRLWEAVKASGIVSEHPIDDFSVATVTAWFRESFPQRRFELVYPGPCAIGLQALGRLAGWHHDSPFMVGMNQEWGSWFAYRVVLLADTDLDASRRWTGASPCAACDARPCIDRCPAAALGSGGFELQKCMDYRRQVGSACRESCLARVSCPVGEAHRYGDEQMRHVYSLSRKSIEKRY